MSADNVVALPNYSAPNNDHVSEVVEILETALRLAKAGEVIGVAISCTYRQPLAFGNTFHAEQSSRHTVAAGVLALSVSIANAMNGDDE